MRGAAVLLLAAAAAAEVIRVQVPFDVDYEVQLTSAVEYILDFVPSGAQAAWPARLRAASDADDPARPLLLTARFPAGAQTWQLPYVEADSAPLHELERTLCFDPAQSAMAGQFSVHLSWAGDAGGAGAARVRVRAFPLYDWLLPFQEDVSAVATLTAPVSRWYAWGAGQDSARLVLAAADGVCALVGVQNRSCPVAETAATLVRAGAYMTMLRSGAVHVARSQYPAGFQLVAAVLASDGPCVGPAPQDDAWLYEAVIGVDAPTTPAVAAAALARTKNFTITVQATLSRGEYAAATGALLAACLAFYAGCLAAAQAQRWPPCRRLVAPKAVLAPSPSPDETEACRRRRRRDSDATFDSGDDSESEEEAPPAAPAPAPAPAPAAADNPAYEPSTPVAPADGAVERVEAAQTENSSHTAGADPATGADRKPGEVDTTAGRGSPPAADGGARSSAPDGAAPSAPAPGQPTADAADSAAPASHNQTQAGAAPPFGLPARLHVAALARRRARTLAARSDRYLSALATVALFYALPVLQFVAAFQIVMNVSGSLDLCYYNFLCAHPAGALADFNHVVSNAPYLLLGALFMLQEYGIPAHYGLVSALGAAMMAVAVLSAAYHVCPNRLNFQFDTAFMYVLAALAMVKLYQARHPDVTARAHAAFALLAVLIAIVVWGVLGGGAVFWGAWTALHVAGFLLLSLRIYYVGQFRLESGALAAAARGLAHGLYRPRLAALLLANLANWALALVGLVTMSADFASHLLAVLLANVLLYMLFYLAMKLWGGERLRWYAWAWLGAAAAAWAPALYYFAAGSSSWALPAARSRHLNHACRLLAFYDAHDLWHALSALALYASLNAMLCWDDGLSARRRSRIAAF